MSLSSLLQAPESFWPESIAGWIAVMLGIFNLATLLWHRARKEAQDEARAEQVRRDLDSMRQSVTSELNGVRSGMTSDLNGYGQRLQRVEEEVAGIHVVTTGMLTSIATLTADVRHTREIADSIDVKADRIDQKVDRILTRPSPP
jgi:hypothetical protein